MGNTIDNPCFSGFSSICTASLAGTGPDTTRPPCTGSQGRAAIRYLPWTARVSCAHDKPGRHGMFISVGAEDDPWRITWHNSRDLRRAEQFGSTCNGIVQQALLHVGMIEIQESQS